MTRNAKVFGVSPYSQSKLDAVILWYGRVRPSRLASHLDKRPPSLSTTMPTAVEAQSRSSSRRTKKRRRVDVERGEATADAEAGSLHTAKRRKESMQPAAESELEEDGRLADGVKSSNGVVGEKSNSTQDTKEKKKRRKKKKKVPVVQQNREGSPSQRKPSANVSAKSTSNSADGHRPASSQKQPTPGPSRLARSPSPATELEPVCEIQQLASDIAEESNPVSNLSSTYWGYLTFLRPPRS